MDMKTHLTNREVVDLASGIENETNRRDYLDAVGIHTRGEDDELDEYESFLDDECDSDSRIIDILLNSSLIRELCTTNLAQELPYQSALVCDKMALYLVIERHPSEGTYDGIDFVDSEEEAVAIVQARQAEYEEHIAMLHSKFYARFLSPGAFGWTDLAWGDGTRPQNYEILAYETAAERGEAIKNHRKRDGAAEALSFRWIEDMYGQLFTFKGEAGGGSRIDTEESFC